MNRAEALIESSKRARRVADEDQARMESGQGRDLDYIEWVIEELKTCSELLESVNEPLPVDMKKGLNAFYTLRDHEQTRRGGQ